MGNVLFYGALVIGFIALMIAITPTCHEGEVLIYPRYGTPACIVGHR